MRHALLTYMTRANHKYYFSGTHIPLIQPVCIIYNKEKQITLINNNKNIFSMKKLLLSLVAVLSFALNANAGDVLYKTLTFPDGNESSIGSYTDTWNATCDGLTWTLANFNNNKNGWAFVKCGRKNDPSTASITTPQLSESITKFVINFDAVNNPSKIKETYLLVASDEKFSANVQKVPFEAQAGDVTIAVPEVKANQYYRLVFDIDVAGSNGIIVIKKVEIYKQDANSVSVPSFSVSAGSIYEATSLTLSTNDGSKIYYSIDGGAETEYTTPITIDRTMTVDAYATLDGKTSEHATATYTFAKTYASIAELLKETPTAEGWPVIVTLSEEEITSFYGVEGQYRNGVYVNYKVGNGNFELYCRDAPADWKVGDKLSGVAKGLYQNYNDQWEISLVSWDGIYVGSSSEVLPPTITFDAESKTVTITPADPSYSTFYTLDGTDPTDASTLYEGPFTIDKTATVKAISTNDDDMASPIASKVCEVAGAALTTCQELTEQCTSTEGFEVTYQFTNVMVTATSGQYVFIKDATGSFLLFKGSTGLKRGDLISGTVKGKLVLYSGVKELSNPTTWEVTTLSSGNEVTPRTVSADEVTPAIQSEYIRLEGLTYLPAEQNGQYYYFTDGKTKVTLFDKFNLMSGVILKETNQYNMNVVATVYKDNAQVYVFSVDDIEAISNKKNPETRFINVATLAAVADGTGSIEKDDYETLSDGAITFTSSNENVATIDNNGVFTIKAAGVTTITIETAETDNYDAGKSSTVLAVVSHYNISGEGEDAEISTGKGIADPWEAVDAQALYAFAMAEEESVEFAPMWYHGYIVGYADGTMNKSHFDLNSGDPIATNILFSSNPKATTADECVPVQLVSKSAERKALNLLDNPGNLGKEVWLYGKLDTYFSIAGIKDLSAFSFDGSDPTAIETVKVLNAAEGAIFNINGQRLNAPQKGLNIINGKKVFIQ